ncbi:MAG: tyrosine-type recombinase/integrase [Candidatus Bathyarchaeia archaeon]
MEEAPAASPTEKPVFQIEAQNGLCCPECGSKKLYRDGFRYKADGSPVQRWLCRVCGLRFSEGFKNKPRANRKNDAHQKAAKLLVEAQGQMEKREAGATTDAKTAIVNFLWALKKDGCSEETLKFYNRVLQNFAKNVDVLDGEAVKEALAKMQISETTKANYAAVFQSFYKRLNIPWEMPKYKPEKKIPFIPTEQELDMLIAHTSKMVSALLQLLKDTGMRVGEAVNLKWADIDFERRTVRVKPEKGSLPRILALNDLTVSMLKRLKPRPDGRIFGSRKNMATAFYKQRKRLAYKLNNPRLLQISFHTFRHWRATMLYHKTRDILYVQREIGHVNIQNTLRYVAIEQAIFQKQSDEYHVKTASTIEEACKLAEAGFEYFDTINGIHIYRKRK